MNENTKKTAKELLQIIATSRQYSKSTSPHDIFINAENIIGLLAYLVAPTMDAETGYRQLIVKFMEEDDTSHAKAEAKAKASDEYAEFKKLERLNELAEHQINLLKKFEGSLFREYQNIK